MSIRFDIFHSSLHAPIATDAEYGQKDPNMQTADNSHSKSSARATFAARPSPRACIVADWLPLKILTSLPELVGGLRLRATVHVYRVLNPPLRDRSIGIAAAQAIAFTTTDPGACTPPWTLQSNPRRCVVDTDGPTTYKGQLTGFQGASKASRLAKVSSRAKFPPLSTSACTPSTLFRISGENTAETSGARFGIITVFSNARRRRNPRYFSTKCT
jgi:hypothetical protein